MLSESWHPDVGTSELKSEMASGMKASEMASMLDLKPHPDGGFFSETFRDPSLLLLKSDLPPRYMVDRSVSTAIYFLLPSGSSACLHRIPCAETFHFYSGEPITVFELHEDGSIKLTILGLDFEAGQRPQYTVPPYTWFGSFPTGDVESYSLNSGSLVLSPTRDPEKHFSLLGVTCAPAFQFEDDELAIASELINLAPHAEAFIQYLTHSANC